MPITFILVKQRNVYVISYILMNRIKMISYKQISLAHCEKQLPISQRSRNMAKQIQECNGPILLTTLSY